jgi:hypothetical protein
MNHAAKPIRAFLMVGILVGFAWSPAVTTDFLVCQEPRVCETYGGLFCNEQGEAILLCENGEDDCWVSCNGTIWEPVTCGLECREPS